MITKNIWKLFPVVIFLGTIIFFRTQNYFERQQFFKSKLNTVIQEKKDDWWYSGRTCKYITNNKITFTLPNSDTLNIKDSISKEKNSWEFYVFRLNEIEGKYREYRKIYMKHFGW